MSISELKSREEELIIVNRDDVDEEKFGISAFLT